MGRFKAHRGMGFRKRDLGLPRNRGVDPSAFRFRPYEKSEDSPIPKATVKAGMLAAMLAVFARPLRAANAKFQQYRRRV